MSRELERVVEEALNQDTPTTPRRVLEALREHLEANPEHVSQLLPDWRLIKRRSPTVDAVRRRVDAATTQRATAAQARYEEIEPILRRAVGENPAITLRELAKVLDEKGPAPARAASWSAAQVKYMMERMRIGYDSTQ